MDVYGVLSLTVHLVNNIIQDGQHACILFTQVSHMFTWCLGRSSPEEIEREL